VTQPITHTIYKGGGVRIAGAYGAHRKAVELGLLDNLQATAGTSAGGLMAALVAGRYSMDEIGQIVTRINFPSFKDGWDPFEEFTKLGLYSGRTLQRFVESLIAPKAGKPFATFADIRDAGWLDLHVVATALNLRDYIVFSADTTPTVIVSEAIRASMSIPLFYGAYRLSQGSTYTYLDGGVVNNYPLTLFDGPAPNPQVLGFFLHNPNPAPPFNVELNAESIALNTFESMLDAQDAHVLRTPSLLNRSVVIDTQGISSTDFNITADQVTALIASGETAMANFKLLL